MNKEELTQFIVDKAGLNKEDARKALELSIQALIADLKKKSQEELTKEIIEAQIKSGNFKKCEKCSKLLKIEEFVCDGCGYIIQE